MKGGWPGSRAVTFVARFMTARKRRVEAGNRNAYPRFLEEKVKELKHTSWNWHGFMKKEGKHMGE